MEEEEEEEEGWGGDYLIEALPWKDLSVSILLLESLMSDWITGWDFIWQREFDRHPVFGSVNTPEEPQCGSSGNKSKNRPILDLNWFTDLFEMEEIQGGKQFHKLDAVNTVWKIL